MEKLFLKIFLILSFTFFFLISGLNSVEAIQPCEPCPREGEKAANLVCHGGKWRGCPEDGIVICNPLRACDFQELADAIINFIFWIATALAPLMIIIAAFYFLTSAGNPRQIETAKNIILYTLIGYAIILVSKGIILVIREILGG